MRPSCFGIALALVVAGPGAALARPVPVDGAGPSRMRFNAHPYTAAMGALANYQSCGIHARAAELRRLNAVFRASEAAARAKGLGPMLDDFRRGYEAMLAVADMVACGGGPAAALAGAHNRVREFREWVAAQPRAGA